MSDCIQLSGHRLRQGPSLTTVERHRSYTSFKELGPIAERVMFAAQFALVGMEGRPGCGDPVIQLCPLAVAHGQLAPHGMSVLSGFSPVQSHHDDPSMSYPLLCPSLRTRPP